MAKTDLHSDTSKVAPMQASAKELQTPEKNVKETGSPIIAPGKPQNPKDMAANSAIDKWADLIYKNLDNAVKVDQSSTKLGASAAKDDLTPTATISRLGIKSPKDIVTFLRSPAGDSLMAKIGTQMAVEKSLDDYRQLELRERQLMMHRIRAAFFLWYLEKKAHAHDKQEEAVLEQNAKAIKNSGKTSTPTPSSTPTTTQKAGLLQAIDDYQQALAKNLERRNELADERNNLDKQLTKLNAEGELITFKYELFDAQLADFDKFLTDHAKLDSKASQQVIEQHIEKIKQKMDEYLLHVEDLIKDNQDEDAAVLMKMHTALGLQLATHHDMLAVQDEKKYYVREDGTEAKSFEEAHYVLDTHLKTEDDALKEIAPELRRERIHKEGNKYYLLKPGQTWDSIKENEDTKNEAHKRFEHKKPELLVVKKLVHHNKGLETEFHQERVEDVKAKIKTNGQESRLAHNQKNIIESSLAQSRTMIQELDKEIQSLNTTTPTPTPAPRPVPTPTVTGRPSTPKPSLASSAQAYKEKLELFKQMPKLSMTPEQLLDLAGQAPGVHKIPARSFVMSEMERRNLPRNAPIPYQTMQFFLKNLERFGVDVTKPSVTNIKNPQELVKEAAKEPKSTAPTALPTTPFKIPGS